jgi:uncharacterized protein (DUF433 family)
VAHLISTTVRLGTEGVQARNHYNWLDGEGICRRHYLAGTRISLDSIVQCFNEGLSPETILGEFETLTLAQVFGAIAFYLENQPAVDAYRIRQKQRFAATQRDAAPLPENLRQRLAAAREQLHSGHSE